MAVEGTYKLMKFLLLVFTFCFWMTGIMMVLFGIYSISDVRFLEYIKYISAVEGSPDMWWMRTGGMLMFICGFICLVVGFFGCIGAFKESRTMLLIYVVCLIFLIVCMVFDVFWCIIARNKTSYIIYTELDRYVNYYYVPGYDEIKFTMDHMQQFGRCCGANGTLDWSLRQVEIPKSCINGFSGERYLRGCSEQIMFSYRAFYGMLISLGIYVTCALLTGLMCTGCLWRSIENSEDKWN